MFTKTRARMFARQNKNSFPSLLTPSIFTEQKREDEPRRPRQPTYQPIESRV